MSQCPLFRQGLHIQDSKTVGYPESIANRQCWCMHKHAPVTKKMLDTMILTDSMRLTCEGDLARCAVPLALRNDI